MAYVVSIKDGVDSPSITGIDKYSLKFLKITKSFQPTLRSNVSLNILSPQRVSSKGQKPILKGRK